MVKPRNLGLQSAKPGAVDLLRVASTLAMDLGVPSMEPGEPSLQSRTRARLLPPNQWRWRLIRPVNALSSHASLAWVQLGSYWTQRIPIRASQTPTSLILSIPEAVQTRRTFGLDTRAGL